MPKQQRSLQSHGRNSRVYVPIMLAIFRAKYRPEAIIIEFTLDDVRDAARALKIVTRNAADVIYRMRSRTKLPPEILDRGFFVLRQTGRGRYRLEKAESTIIEIPRNPVQDAIDLTPLPVRRLLPEALADIDEQGLLTIIGYCKLLDHFTGLQVYRLRSHVRKSVTSIGQVELDEVDVAVALRDDESPVIFTVEAKAADEAVNRVQIAGMVTFSHQYFPNLEVRPIAVKLDYDSLVHFIEFNATREPRDLHVVRSASYRLTLSAQQIELIRKTAVSLQ